MILVVNTSFPELNQLAAGLAEVGLLSTYVRPYANLQRPWERQLAHFPGLGQAYRRTLGRRRVPQPLTAAVVRETAVIQDMLMAAHARLSFVTFAHKHVSEVLMHARTNAIARIAANTLTNEQAVVASWGCAELVFRKAKTRGALCVLNYSLAHHRFTRKYLRDEAVLQPAFAGTLNSHDQPEWLERRLDNEIELADHILVGSSFVRESFIAEGVAADKLMVVPYGANTHTFEPAGEVTRAGKNFRLLFVGQIGQRKGISYLLEAARRLHGLGITLTLVGKIQGDGKALAPYRGVFRHSPHIPQTELRQTYRESDVFVFPTLVEGLPLVVLEAMSSGLPVITTPNGLSDIVRDGTDGFLVPPRDVDAIINRIQLLKSDPQLRAEMGRNARCRALDFSWDVYRQRAVKCITERVRLTH